METQGKLKAWCSSKWRGMMKMQRLERGVGPIGSFFSGSQYLVQLSMMSSRPCYSPGGGRINLKGEGTLCYSITYFLKTAKCWTPTKSLTFKKKELLPPNTSKGQMVYWNVVFYLSTAMTLGHGSQEGVCEGSCHCWVWGWKDRSVLDHLVESPPFVHPHHFP